MKELPVRVFLICLVLIIGIAMPLSCVTLGTGSTSAGSGGAMPRGSTATTSSTSSSSSGAPCDLCASGFSGSKNLCPSSKILFDDYLNCACSTTCAPVCSSAGIDSGTACHALDQNPPSGCKSCMSNPSGCGLKMSACANDDGATAPVVVDAGAPCSCPAGVQLCPASWSCASPGDYTHSSNGACGSAQYCAACCDPTDGCSSRGTCVITGVSGESCSTPEACCSGVCARGKCIGGCGVVLPGSGAGASSASSSSSG